MNAAAKIRRRRAQKLVKVFGDFNRSTGYGQLWRRLLIRHRREQRWQAGYQGDANAVTRRALTSIRKEANRIALSL